MSLPPLALGIDPPDAGPPSTFKLFSIRDVGVATLLGSVLAGAILLAINYRRLGQGRAARICLVLGIAATAIIVWAAYRLGDRLPVGTVVAIGCVVGMRSVAGAFQGRAMAAHRAAGGHVGSGWTSAGVGVISMGVVAGAVIGLVFIARGSLGDSIELGKLTVYYKDGVTESEARTTGLRLRAIGMSDQEADVQLRRVDGTPHIVFVMDGRNPPEDALRAVGRDVAQQSFGGAAVVVDLADGNLDIYRSVPVEAGAH